ncbi:MAG: NADH-quinone oxidoreductase subunit NuoB [Collinsella sp.]
MDHKMSRSPWVIHYDGSSCNGCDIEVLASLTPLFDAERFGVVNTGNPKHADIFLVTGSVNAQNLPVVRQIYNQMLEPKCVVACGICACSGGVFRDAYNVIGGVDRAIPVDVYAPGCAIRPETVIDAIVEACGILDQKEAVMRAGGDPLTVGGAATWDGGVELGEDGFVAAGAGADGAGDGVEADCPPGSPLHARRCKGGRVMQKAIYTTVGIDELLSHVQALKGVGARFVQMHAERSVDDGSYRLVYTFINVRAAQEHIAQDGSYAIENLVVEGIDQYQEIPSISSYYPAVFPFENEAHDLFGLAITDMQIDFKGFFYQVSTAEPMSVITPEVKAAREKAMKVRAAAEAKARKAAAEKAAAAAAAAGEGAASAGDAAGAAAQPAAAAGSDAQHDDAAAKAALKAAEMEAKLAAMDPEKAAKVRAALAAKAARDKQKKEA